MSPINALQGLILALKYGRFYNLGCVIVYSCYFLILFHMRIYELFFGRGQECGYLFGRHFFHSLDYLLILGLFNASEKVDEGVIGFPRIEVAHMSEKHTAHPGELVKHATTFFG